jgi:hypothetical protein
MGLSYIQEPQTVNAIVWVLLLMLHDWEIGTIQVGKPLLISCPFDPAS